jgi:hypothetical protein
MQNNRDLPTVSNDFPVANWYQNQLKPVGAVSINLQIAVIRKAKFALFDFSYDVFSDNVPHAIHLEMMIIVLRLTK